MARRKRTSRTNRLISFFGALLISNVLLINKDFRNKLCLTYSVGCFTVAVKDNSISLLPYPDNQRENNSISLKREISTGDIISDSVTFNSGVTGESLEVLLIKLQKIKSLKSELGLSDLAKETLSEIQDTKAIPKTPPLKKCEVVSVMDLINDVCNTIE